MEHMDEKILDMINEVKDKRSLNILEEVRVLGKRYIFQEQRFFDEKLKVYIPESFEELPLEAAKVKYPSESRPQIIKTDKGGSINITFSMIDQEVTDGDIKEIKDGMRTIIKNTQPANVFYDDEVIEANEKKIGFFEFKSYALDGPMFNIMFLLEVHGLLVLGTTSCMYRDYKYWRPVFKQIIENISVECKQEE